MIVVQWPDNTVIVSESFDATTAAQLSNAVRDGNAAIHAQAEPQRELGVRLCSLPAFRALQADIAARLLLQLSKTMRIQ